LLLFQTICQALFGEFEGTVTPALANPSTQQHLLSRPKKSTTDRNIPEELLQQDLGQSFQDAVQAKEQTSVLRTPKKNSPAAEPAQLLMEFAELGGVGLKYPNSRPMLITPAEPGGVVAHKLPNSRPVLFLAGEASPVAKESIAPPVKPTPVAKTAGRIHKSLEGMSGFTPMAFAAISGVKTCKDRVEGWTDSLGYSCADYAENEYCTAKKGYGTGWESDFGSFEDYAVKGVDALAACCVCGAVADPEPCKDNIEGWIDSLGYSCADYVKNAYCTPDKGYGTGWDKDFGTFDVYAVNGVDAIQACCRCGAEKAPAPTPITATSEKNAPPFYLLPKAKDIWAPISPQGPCKDKIEGWKDSLGYTCAEYVENEYCTPSKGYGVGWEEGFGAFASYEVNGIDATEACCKCGATIDPCKDKVDGWVDSLGYSCYDYVDKAYCTPDKSYGIGWEPEFGHFKDYAKNGVDATEACCMCGGENAQPLVEEAEPVEEEEDPCEDKIEGWTDTYGYSCKDYSAKGFCTPNGGYGIGWEDEWGKFFEYATNGWGATESCCSCGGGTAKSKIKVRAPKVLCQDTEQWTDSFGFDCDYYVSNKFCTADKGYGVGWRYAWGSFRMYATLGVDATGACCSCGKEAIEEETQSLEDEVEGLKKELNYQKEIIELQTMQIAKTLDFGSQVNQETLAQMLQLQEEETLIQKFQEETAQDPKFQEELQMLKDALTELKPDSELQVMIGKVDNLMEMQKQPKVPAFYTHGSVTTPTSSSAAGTVAKSKEVLDAVPAAENTGTATKTVPIKTSDTPDQVMTPVAPWAKNYGSSMNQLMLKFSSSFGFNVSRMPVMADAYIMNGTNTIMLAEHSLQSGIAAIPTELPLILGFETYHFGITFDLKISKPIGCDGGAFMYKNTRSLSCVGATCTKSDDGSFTFTYKQLAQSFQVDGQSLVVQEMMKASTFYDRIHSLTFEYKFDKTTRNLRQIHIYSDGGGIFIHDFTSTEPLGTTKIDLQVLAINGECDQKFEVSNIVFSTSKVLTEEDVGDIDRLSVSEAATINNKFTLMKLLQFNSKSIRGSPPNNFSIKNRLYSTGIVFLGGILGLIFYMKRTSFQKFGRYEQV